MASLFFVAEIMSEKYKYKNQKEIKSVSEMRDFAVFVLNNLGDLPNNFATILALSGDLGSGKTTFTQQLAQVLGIRENVTSPTFIIQKKYSIEGWRVNDKFSTEKDQKNRSRFSQIIHMDMYRIEDEDELVGVGFDEIVNNPNNLIVIEWPEKIAETLKFLENLKTPQNPESPETSPADSCQIIRLNFQFVDETTRRVQWWLCQKPSLKKN